MDKTVNRHVYPATTPSRLISALEMLYRIKKPVVLDYGQFTRHGYLAVEAQSKRRGRITLKNDPESPGNGHGILFSHLVAVQTLDGHIVYHRSQDDPSPANPEADPGSAETRTGA